jgi:mono/diheme cytochrome c family protein
MKRTAGRTTGVFLLLWGLGATAGCDYARMKEQESIRTYETQLPEMDPGSVPVGGGLQLARAADPDALRNPLPFDDKSVALGEERYGFYCVMCHGPNADGRGTVGQSFHPLPADLKSPEVQGQSDGMLFQKISLGSKRAPALLHTVAEKDRWAIIHFIRSLIQKSGA